MHVGLLKEQGGVKESAPIIPLLRYAHIEVVVGPSHWIPKYDHQRVQPRACHSYISRHSYKFLQVPLSLIKLDKGRYLNLVQQKT